MHFQRSSSQLEPVPGGVDGVASENQTSLIVNKVFDISIGLTAYFKSKSD
jgi:hypothetical protein